jgi:hypothetical protein
VAPKPLGAVISTVVRSSSTAAATTGEGGTPNSSTTVATAIPSTTCAGSGSVHEGWGQGSEGMTRALWAKRCRGARLSKPVSAYLQEDRSKVNKQNK